VPHLRDGLIVAKVGHFRGSENPDIPIGHAAKTSLADAETRTTFPKREAPKNKSENLHVFRPRKNTTQNTTIHHAIHHNFTTIYHHKTHQNPQNPL
jgi:hypothetical protein